MKNPQSLRFDEQRNSFYRVNKDTGQQIKSYVNGQNLPSFKPSITGKAFHREKITDPNFYSLKHSSPPKSRSPEHKKSPLAKTSKFATLDAYGGAQINWKNTKTYQTFANSTGRKTTLLNFTSSDMKSTIPQSFLTEGTGRAKMFEETARSFSVMKEEKVRDNHSPNKEVSGSVQKNPLYETICYTKSNFYPQNHRNNNAKDQSLKNLKYDHKLKLPEQLSSPQQYKKDKKLFYRFRPDMIYKQNPKSIEKQKDRKRNLIQLERLMLKTTERKLKSSMQQ